ncbi:hypothetical protein PV350_33790 [Streptomyces sp. PA03-6a]|nr:hypothetical protein [Streptomyces sp. PA03-6a]
MVDAHHVPPELQNLLLITTGPTGDEAALRAEATVWRETAHSLRTLLEHIETVRWLTARALSGSGQDAVDAFLAQLTGGRGVGETDAIVPALIEAAESAADALEAEALQIETLRIQIIGALVVLFLQLIIDSALWMFGGEAKAAADIAATRVLCMAFVRQAVTHMLTRLTESVVAMVGMDLLAQIIEIGRGHRRSPDGHELGVAAVNGAVGGAVGFGMGLVGGAAMNGLKNLTKKPIFTNLPHHAQSLTKIGTVVTFNAGFGALTGMTEAAAQDSVYGLSGDWVAGAANGSFNAVWGARHNAQNPAGRFALSPAEHAERFIDHHLARLNKTREQARPTNQPTIENPYHRDNFLNFESDTASTYPPRGDFLDFESDTASTASTHPSGLGSSD